MGSDIGNLKSGTVERFQAQVLSCLVGAFVLVPAPSFSQPKSGLRLAPVLNPVESEQKGRALVAELLGQRPQETSTNTGKMRIRDTGGKEREVTVTFAVVCRPADWLNTYETPPESDTQGERLAILHCDSQPNQYCSSRVLGSGSTNVEALRLSADKLMVPFAGSDFWIADLGLEFLHWPQQLLLKQEMRRSRSCNVLASINPHPMPGGYSRVVSWIDIESGGIVLAQAFDLHEKLLKEFAPKEMKKVQGQWQLEEMEIKNVQAGSRTRVQFNLDP